MNISPLLDKVEYLSKVFPGRYELYVELETGASFKWNLNSDKQRSRVKIPKEVGIFDYEISDLVAIHTTHRPRLLISSLGAAMVTVRKNSGECVFIKGKAWIEVPDGVTDMFDDLLPAMTNYQWKIDKEIKTTYEVCTI